MARSRPDPAPNVRRRWLWLGALLLCVPGSVAVAAQAAPRHTVASPPDAASPQACLRLSGTGYPSKHAPARVLAAQVVPAQTPTPQYCHATGTVLSRIHFALDMPIGAWTRDYVQIGNGGFGGSIPTATAAPTTYLRDRAAVASDDTGHPGTPLDATFAYPDNRQAQIDWGYRSEHALSIAARTIVARFYGASVKHSYFIGCSTGGRQALMEAQRYPKDFNGVVSGDPANYQNLLAPLEQGYRELANRDANHRLILTAADATTVQNAVVKDCDARDGVADGILNDPRRCAFPIESLECKHSGRSGCLSAAQVAVLARWYDDPRNARGRRLFPADAGLPVGSEGGWVPYDILTDATFSLGGMFADQVLRFLAFPKSPPPTYGLYQFNFTTDPPKLATMSRIYNADNPRMSAFRRAGGKLILYHGFADPLISPYGSIRYYERVLRVSGGLAATTRWFRFFLLPGMYHCSGGPGPDTVDWYTAIRGWVEKHHAPHRLIAAKLSNGTVTMTRPLFPYPLEARYIGRGDPNNAASFRSARGPRGTRIAVAFGKFRHRHCETLC